MKRIWTVLSILFLSLTFTACGDDIKGEPGQDATAEALVTFKRPSFHSEGGIEIIVEADQLHPAKIRLNDTTYTNTTDVRADMSVSGRNGLDIGSLQPTTLYYVYAVPAESGSTFDVVASRNDPDSGPTGFEDVSYLGAFMTDSAPGSAPVGIIAFSYSNGTMLMNGASQTLRSHSTSAEAFDLLLPVRATAVYGQLHIDDAPSENIRAFAKSQAGASVLPPLAVNSTGLDVLSYNAGYVPLIEGNRIYLNVENASAEALFHVLGWIEDPTLWP